MLAVWIVFILFFLWMAWLDNQLKSVGQGFGILNLQFAFDANTATRILEGWGIAGRALALKGLLWDSFYPIAYGLA